jgi:hypothetical protein
MALPMSPTKKVAEFAHLYACLETVRIHLLNCGGKYNVHRFVFQQLAVPLKVTRISGKVFLGSELCRIDEDRYHDAVCPASSKTDEAEMTFMEKPHRRDKRYPPALASLGFTPALHLGNFLYNLHGP